MDDPRLARLLEILIDRGGSDLFLVTGEPPFIRVTSKVQRLNEDALSASEVEALVLPWLPPAAVQQNRAGLAVDCAFRWRSGRFRLNFHRERGQPAAAIRALPRRTPQIDELGFPPTIGRLASIPHGLVLVGGPTGSGKTTTVAALIHEINRHQAKHIITIEDPIEYEHVSDHSLVEQVEIGIDAPDFPTALRSALRQAPDVIVVGEMRDTETMQIALAAGETGHLVLSTIHTTDMTSTISRVADSFAGERQATIRQELAMALSAVMTQVLLPAVSGERVVAAELLFIGYGARQHIRKNALQHLHQEISITRGEGSFSFEECLAALVKKNRLSAAFARMSAIHPDEFDALVR